MSERRSTKALFLVFLMLTSVIAQGAANETENDVDNIADSIGVVYGDLTDFNVETGSQYLLSMKFNPWFLRHRSLSRLGLTKVARVLTTSVPASRWLAQPARSMLLAIH